MPNQATLDPEVSREPEGLGTGWELPNVPTQQENEWGTPPAANPGEVGRTPGNEFPGRAQRNDDNERPRPLRREQYSRPPIEELMGGKREVLTDDDLEKRMARIKEKNEAIRRKKKLVEEDERQYSAENGTEPVADVADGVKPDYDAKRTSERAVLEELKAERERNAERKRREMSRRAAYDDTVWVQVPIEEDMDYLVSRFGDFAIRSQHPRPGGAPRREFPRGDDKPGADENIREGEYTDWPAVKVGREEERREPAPGEADVETTRARSDDAAVADDGDEEDGAAAEAGFAHDRVAAESEGSEIGDGEGSDESGVSSSDDSSSEGQTSDTGEDDDGDVSSGEEGRVAA